MSELLKKKFKINGKSITAKEAEICSWNMTHTTMGITSYYEGWICGVGHDNSWKEFEDQLKEMQENGDIIEGYEWTPERDIPDIREEVYFDYDY